MSLWSQSYFTVSQITAYIKELLDTDVTLRDLWVEGEVSNFSLSASGHIYFSLKDQEAVLRCVMWRSAAQRQNFLPRDGDSVLAHGYVSLYPSQGLYQFYVDLIQPAGVGILYMEMEQLKARLAAEGLFDEARKRSLPAFPRRIGLVTSPFGAAIRDVLRVLSRRFPLAEVVLSPTQVQGEEAPSQIVAAIEALNAYGDVDLIILTRGGGSFEELMAFNDERVVRAVAASRIPVVCGVGHEVDYTLADMAADLRAPTPSAAAERAVPDRDELLRHIRGLESRLLKAAESRLGEARRLVEKEARSLVLASPQRHIDLFRQKVDDLATRARWLLEHRFELTRTQLASQKERLLALDPQAVLERGYAIVSHKDGPVVTSVAQVQRGDPIEVRVSDGKFGGVVTEAEP